MKYNSTRRVKEEFDWDGYVKENFTVKYTPSEELRICCFVCGDTKFKLYINPVKRTFHCFKCDFSMKNHDVFDFVAKNEGLSRYQAVERLLREYAKTTPSDDTWNPSALEDDPEPLKVVPQIRPLFGMPEGLVTLEERTEESAPFWDYLTDRGLTESEIHAIGAMYTSESELPVLDSKNRRRGDLAQRVVIPVYGGDHQLVSWQARHIDKFYKGDDRYLVAPESDLAKTVWPFVKPRGKHAVIVEGIFDCLAVRRIPEVNAYATFTKKISLDQILCLRAWGIEELTLFWDKRDAKPQMEQALPELHMSFKKVYVCHMKDWPEKLDAGNMLADPQGADKLRAALNDRVDTYDALEFIKWSLSF